ncbi:hypothetical protein [Vibrio cyclitrophicus]|uniref:hypothetical protein n=1 Tax=Vibrio cyclitrophicus TaxID=47951 RepID=UPI00030B241C|nr:hypothetical protein [Vibrio cyclitrophicus]OEF46295.1 hypothetical protein OAC_18765 [Vibrio cyclitrophicus 1F273]UPR48839.1 hypothetical protein ITG13_06520 [Vibrio cyclitrophicus]|tara:strand:- start:451 stop:678 length:228 start_codon:yes stop_codon:yes gene_type:complete
MSNERITFKPTIEQYNAFSNEPEVQRMFAVAAALELIQADVTGSTENKTNGLLNSHMEQLSSYADHIQEALKVEK